MSGVLVEDTGEIAAYLEAFPGTAAAEPSWLSARRQAALDRFAELGLPTRRDENWRYTDLKPLRERAFLPNGASDASPARDLDLYRTLVASYRLVLVNGHFDPALSSLSKLPKGVWIGSLAQALETRQQTVADMLDRDARARQPFVALNAAFFRDGYCVVLEDGAALDKPLEIIHLTRLKGGRSIHSRGLVLAGRDSRAAIAESFGGEGSYWTNVVRDIRIGAGAQLQHLMLQDESRNAIHLADTRAELDAHGCYDSFLFTVGAQLSRHDVSVAIAGEHARCAVHGAYLLRGRQEATHAVFIDHAAPCCGTREVFKGVVEDRAHGVFQGKIAVRPEAQKTDAHQLNKNLLLSPLAAVDTKPELEIFADDVKCSHGATVGELDETALFYLRARGIPEIEARRMLIEAFAEDAIELVENEPLQMYLRRHLQAWLAPAARVQP